MSAPTQPQRLFLDTGVIVAGCFLPWGASKAVLILATLRANFTVVLAEAVEQELQQVVARRGASLSADGALRVAEDVAGWLERVRIERHPMPTPEAIRSYLPLVLPVLRHGNDLAPVITAIQAKPDWVISANTAHWNDNLAARTGLRIATPRAFLAQFHPA